MAFRRPYIILLALYLYTSLIYAQTPGVDGGGILVKGKVVDTENRAVLYASVYLEETKSAYATNESGEFSFHLKPGVYTFHVGQVNYENLTQVVDISQSRMLTFRLTVKNFTLREVEVKAGKEDPAYAIMRKAIAKAPYHRRQFDFYKAEVYSKATLEIQEIPEFLAKQIEKSGDKSLNPGDIYTRESISEVRYSQDSLRQRVLSVRSTFPEEIETGDLDRFNLMNIYARTGGFVSPLSAESLAVYRFRLENSSYDKYGKRIYHIQVIPKNNNPYAFTGYLDIVDSTWHVHYFSLSAGMDLSIVSMNFTIKQNFGELEENIWVPFTSYLDQTVGMLGFKANIKQSSSIQYGNYLLRENTEVKKTIEEMREKSVSQSVKSQKLDRKIEDIYTKEQLNNRDVLKLISLLESKEKEDRKNNSGTEKKADELEIKRRNYNITVDRDAYTRDSVYWNEHRRVPLTEKEKHSYALKEADTVRKNKLSALRNIDTLLVAGNNRLQYGFKGIQEILTFNPVDGIKLKLGGRLNWKFKDSTIWYNSLILGGAFKRKAFVFRAETGYEYYPEKRAAIFLSGGKDSRDFNTHGGIHPYVNLLSTLFFRRNYVHVYDQAYLQLVHHIEPFNGFDTRVSFSYEWRGALSNNSNYSFFYRKSREYPPNIPGNRYIEQNPGLLDNGRGALLDVELSYTPKRYYRYLDRNKIPLHSNFPTFTFLWRKGIPHIAGSNTDFDYLEFSVTQKISRNILRSYSYHLYAGWFPNNSRMHFSEFRHFRVSGFTEMLGVFSDTYHSIRVYQASTNQWMLSGFFKYESLYLLLKYIPFLNKTLMTESLYLSYLKTPYVKDFIEIGYSLNNILMFVNLGVFVSFENFKYYGWNFNISFALPN